MPRTSMLDGNLSTYQLIGSLAQAARNYIHTGTQHDLRVLDRLAAEALDMEPILSEEPSK